MSVTTLSSREFNQHASEAKRAATDGPVFITDRGKPAHVLMSIAEYRKLTGTEKSIADWLALPAEVELEVPVFGEAARSAELD